MVVPFDKTTSIEFTIMKRIPEAARTSISPDSANIAALTQSNNVPTDFGWNPMVPYPSTVARK